jgi:hypothetical protein
MLCHTWKYMSTFSFGGGGPFCRTGPQEITGAFDPRLSTV